MIEDHFDTRQEYVKMGNELASLTKKREEQQAQEKKEQEMAATQEKTVSFQGNSGARTGDGNNPVSVPLVHNHPSTNAMPPQHPNNSRPFNEQSNLGVNVGRRGFENQATMPNQSMANRPFHNPSMMNPRGRF